MKIYMDVCCLNRPFDDQTQERIRIESENCAYNFKPMHGRLITKYQVSKEKVNVDDNIVKRALELEMTGLKPIDALHVACAEKSAEVMLTTDDK